MSESKMVLRTVNGTLSVTIFESTISTQYGDRKAYSAAIRKAVKKKDSDEWDEYKLTLFEDDMIKAAELLSMAHQDLLRHKADMRKNAQPAETTADVPEIGDDIPF